MHNASCLCGAVGIDVDAAEMAPNACHCSMCRKQSGHYWASVDVPKTALTIHGAENVAWYQASEKVRRGFCKTCGSFLFFDALFQDWTAIAYLPMTRATITTLPMDCPKTASDQPFRSLAAAGAK